MKKLFLLVFLSVWLTGALPAAAQQKSVVDLGPDLNYMELNQRLNKISQSIKKGTATSEELGEDVTFINQTRFQLESVKKDIERDLEFVQKRIEALGEEPKDGSKEIAVIAQKRKEFNAELATEKGRVAEVEILLTRMDELDLAIFNLRNEELLGNLLLRTTPLLYPAELFNSSKLFIGFVFDMIASPVDWYKTLSQEEVNTVKSRIIPVLLLVAFIIWLGWGMRMFIMRHFGYRKDIEAPHYGKKILAAISVAIAYGVIPTLIIGSFLFWSASSKILTTGFFGMAVNSFMYYSLYVIMGRAISRVIFTPYNEHWRLIHVSTPKAKSVTAALYFSVTVIGFTAFLKHLVSIGNYPIELLTFLMSVDSAIKAFCIALITKRLLWEEKTAGEENTLPEEELGDGELSTGFKVTFFVSLFAIGVFALSLFGYPYLSSFILNRVIASVLIIGAIMAVRKSFYEVVHRLLLIHFWVKTFRLRRRIIYKIDFWSNLIIDPLFALSGLFIILAVWGVPTDVLSGLIMKLLTGFSIGGVQISLLSIALGLLTFWIAIALIRALKRRLEDNVLARMEIDEGIKHSLASGFGSLGYVAAALLAIAIMGGNLTNFALVAGALSVGIGLGLQGVVNNFVSGIILLFERPIKVGDWVVINNEEGRVKQINIRSTEIETFKKSSVIIPNATLLSSSITNLTHSNNWARYSVTVSVAYGSDTEQVKRILMECAQNCKRVLKKPEPYVLFQNFGASGLEFELRIYVNDIWNGWTVPSELRFEINRRFAEEGIEIPFNQLVVHQGSKVSQETQTQFYALRKKGTKDASEGSAK